MQPREAKWRSAGALVHSWGSHMSTTDHIAALNTSREAMPSYTRPCQVIHSLYTAGRAQCLHQTTPPRLPTLVHVAQDMWAQDRKWSLRGSMPNQTGSTYMTHTMHWYGLIFISGMEGSLCWYSRLFLYATSSDSHSPSFKGSYRIPGVPLLFWLISSSPR